MTRLLDVFDLSDRTLCVLAAQDIRTAEQFAAAVERHAPKPAADLIYDLGFFLIPYDQCEADAAAILATVTTAEVQSACQESR